VLPTLLWAALYWVPFLYVRLRMAIEGTQDLKKKYDATWALVTGGSTGIGLPRRVRAGTRFPPKKGGVWVCACPHVPRCVCAV